MGVIGESKMHEISFADRILREAKKIGAENYIRVEVGELCEITAEELERGLKMLTRSVVPEGDLKVGNMVRDFGKVGEGGVKKISDWGFDVVEKKSRIECDCGYVGRAAIVDRGHGYCLFNCPNCSGKAKVLEGGEIKILEVN